jgi:mono/diheme cytochrome c family protein
LVILALSLLLLVACGDRDEPSSASSGNIEGSQSAPPATEAPAAPTMPAGNFTAVGEQSILTDTANLTQTQTITTSAPTVDLAVGQRAYERNKCGDCHGAQGEGVADKGNAIAGAQLTLEEFDEILRTGADIGNSHIFGRSAVSPTGMEALYAYVQSLK